MFGLDATELARIQFALNISFHILFPAVSIGLPWLLLFFRLRYTATRVHVAVVSGAARPEIEPVIRAAGLADSVGTIVASEDVAEGKPHPAGYLRALALLDGGLQAPDVLVFEDTEAGVTSAKAAGMRCLAVLGTLPPDRLAQADEIVSAIDVPLMQRLLD